MKKLLGWLLALMLALSAVTAVAEGAGEGQTLQAETTGSEFEQVLLKKGALLKKEFVDRCSFQNGSLNLQSACLTDIETGRKFYALRITGEYYNSQYDNGEVVGVMDADEIDGAISTLEYIKEHREELIDYTEIEYTANSGMSIGVYHSDSSEYLFIKFNSRVTKYYGTDTIDELIAAFTQVKDTFQ